MVLGIEGAKAWRNGEDWRKYMRSWLGLSKPNTRLRDDVKDGKIKEKVSKDIVEKTLGIKKGAELTIEDAVKGANPNYHSSHDYKINCQRCVQAYELRRRGYDVVAKPKPSVNNKILC